MRTASYTATALVLALASGAAVLAYYAIPYLVNLPR